MHNSISGEDSAYRVVQERCHDILWSYYPQTGRFTYSTVPTGIAEIHDPLDKPAGYRSILVDASFRFVTDLLDKRDSLPLDRFNPVCLEIPVDEEFPGGDSIYLELRISSMKGGEWSHGILGVTRDITREKRLENTLMKTEALYRTLMKVSPDAMIILDGEQDVVKANNRAASLLGMNRSEMIGAGLPDFVDPNQKNSLCELLMKETGDDRVVSGEYEFIRGDGNRFIGEVRVSSLREDGYGLDASVVTIRDMTVRKEAEAEIRVSEERYSNLIEAMNEGMIIFDWNLLIGYINRSASEIFGYSLDDLLGKPLNTIFDDRSYEKFEKELVISRTMEGYKKKFELKAIRKNGETACVLVSLSTIISRSGKYLGSFAVVTDITREKRADQQRRRVEKKLLDLFLSRLSERETELLSYLINGYRWPEQKREICKLMDVLPSTLDKFMSRIRKKMDIDDIDTILTIARRKIKPKKRN